MRTIVEQNDQSERGGREAQTFPARDAPSITKSEVSELCATRKKGHLPWQLAHLPTALSKPSAGAQITI